MRVIFMGTPNFAVPALKLLIESKEHEVVAVYSQPPRPAGRGYKTQPSPVQELAEKHAIPVYTPTSLKTEDVQQAFSDLKADVAIVVAYGLILPKPILAACKYGCLNIHPSLLPRWRGAAPVQRTIMAGDKDTAVAIIQMDEGLDTGDILAIEEVPLADDAFPQLHDILAFIGAKLVLEVLDKIDDIEPQPQSGEGTMYAYKIRKEEGEIDWRLSAYQIDCLIRALTPFPGAYFNYNNEMIKILEATYEDGDYGTGGKILDSSLTISCGHGIIRPKLLQRPGRQAMPTELFLRGYPIKVGTQLPLSNKNTVH